MLYNSYKRELVWLSKCLNERRLGELTSVSLSEFQAAGSDTAGNKRVDSSIWCGQMDSVLSSLLPVC